jgi:hypothetical protein
MFKTQEEDRGSSFAEGRGGARDNVIPSTMGWPPLPDPMRQGGGGHR